MDIDLFNKLTESMEHFNHEQGRFQSGLIDESLFEVREKLRKYSEYYTRHHAHEVGDKLYYRCEWVKDWREGVVHSKFDYYGKTMYTLEVQTNCPLGESFLVLQSEFQVRTEGEL